ncbi:hypothetical protein EDC18_10676 [Natranaerovirga pectinivora]|uniref:Uncharacterized protein n=1 Tax=Natranaerovirga pectinivora TaxID=682400 RepID=A0A4R3MNL6_9FIRM|nr:hypothetical protein [Natranaerovirga pectinivora]TCT14279.1 hypothetical protein EDC18_10676 [Natranaerovirga pectinivora]
MVVFGSILVVIGAILFVMSWVIGRRKGVNVDKEFMELLFQMKFVIKVIGAVFIAVGGMIVMFY